MESSKTWQKQTKKPASERQKLKCQIKPGTKTISLHPVILAVVLNWIKCNVAFTQANLNSTFKALVNIIFIVK